MAQHSAGAGVHLRRAGMTNPYAPPQSDVGASDSPPSRRRPVQIVVAVALSWLSLGIGLVADLVDSARVETTVIEQTPPLVFALITSALLIATIAWINYAIWRGRNWGRIVYALLVALTAAGAIWLSAEVGESTFAEDALYTASWILDGMVLALCFFGPGRLWFNKPYGLSPSP
jgi:hypothetical protein